MVVRTAVIAFFAVGTGLVAVLISTAPAPAPVLAHLGGDGRSPLLAEVQGAAVVAAVKSRAGQAARRGGSNSGGRREQTKCIREVSSPANVDLETILVRTFKNK